MLLQYTIFHICACQVYSFKCFWPLSAKTIIDRKKINTLLNMKVCQDISNLEIAVFATQQICRWTVETLWLRLLSKLKCFVFSFFGSWNCNCFLQADYVGCKLQTFQSRFSNMLRSKKFLFLDSTHLMSLTTFLKIPWKEILFWNTCILLRFMWADAVSLCKFRVMLCRYYRKERWCETLDDAVIAHYNPLHKAELWQYSH